MSLSKFENVKISGLLTVVPERHINIDDELELFNGDKMKLERHKKILGLGKRHVVSEGMSVGTMCEEAARLLMAQTHIGPDEIDTVIATSNSHDYNGNSTACLIQGNLGLSEETACFDTSGLGCTDSVYGLWLAHSLIQSDASRKCLFLEGSVGSLLTDVRNRKTCILFGDAAAAVLLERTAESRPAFFHLKSFGREWKKLVTPAGGFKLPVRKDIIDLELKDPEGNITHLWDLVMSGEEIFRFVMEHAPESVQTLLDFAGLTRDDLDFFGIHQANGQIVRTVINHAQIPKAKASAETFSKYGNCSGTSVLVNLCDIMKNSPIGKVQLISFGVGMSVASCILDLSQAHNGGLHLIKAPAEAPTRQQLIEEWVDFIERGNV